MKGTAFHQDFFIPPPSSFIPAFGRRSQVVRQRSAKPLFIGSIPIAASKSSNYLQTVSNLNQNLTVGTFVGGFDGLRRTSSALSYARL